MDAAAITSVAYRAIPSLVVSDRVGRDKGARRLAANARAVPSAADRDVMVNVIGPNGGRRGLTENPARVAARDLESLQDGARRLGGLEGDEPWLPFCRITEQGGDAAAL